MCVAVMATGSIATDTIVDGRYRLIELLGEGGVAETYRSMHVNSGDFFAVKIIKKSAVEQAGNYTRFLNREHVTHIASPHIVRSIEKGKLPPELGSRPYLVQEFIEGSSLQDLMNGNNPVDTDTLLLVARALFAGLSACHDQGLYHRDISPDNIMLRNGDPALAVLIDFGLARDTRPGQSSILKGGYGGKDAYIAPEQSAGVADEKTDIFSAGMTLLAAATGCAPNRFPSRYTQNSAPTVDDAIARLDHSIRFMITMMIQPDRTKRPESISEVARVLSAIMESEAVRHKDDEKAASETRVATSNGDQLVAAPTQSRSNSTALPKPEQMLTAVELMEGLESSSSLEYGSVQNTPDKIRASEKQPEREKRTSVRRKKTVVFSLVLVAALVGIWRYGLVNSVSPKESVASIRSGNDSIAENRLPEATPALDPKIAFENDDTISVATDLVSLEERAGPQSAKESIVNVKRIHSNNPVERAELGESLVERVKFAEAAYSEGNYEQAADLWKPLSDAGMPLAQFWMGRLHNTGQGVELDRTEAYILWRNASSGSGGLPQAATALSNLASRLSPKEIEIAERRYAASRRVVPAADYSIQIGAFRKRLLAERRLKEVERLRRTARLEGAVPIVSFRIAGGRPLYRARFGGLEKTAAVSACEELESKGFDCFVVIGD